MTMTGNEIRQKFLEYFEQHGHTCVRSSPLLPANDPTLLFVNAGMNQFKDLFLGVEKREYVRACSSQKCLRAGGKHNDLDEVGKTARHQTFFEMLGNFSFGDYFKEDAIKYAWDLLVNEFKLDPARMWFTVFGGDDEVSADEDAERLWEQVGSPRDRVLRFGRKDNFWQMGETGPCGPCSEIHYYMGADASDAENCAANVNGHGDTITEIWNLVFMQFDRSEVESGKYALTPLPAPSVDTGMGLERLAVILQGVKSNYETDLLKDIVEFTANLAGRKYDAETQEGFAMRVIADHARATAFSITDGIAPGPNDRNSVLRKIMRRAIYHGRHALGFEDLFFHQVTNFVVDQMHEAYPELEASRDYIERMVKLEEERFGSTLTRGLAKLTEWYKSRIELTGGHRALTKEDYTDLARLYDTHGVPSDLIRVFLVENKFQIDENAFEADLAVALVELQASNSPPTLVPVKKYERYSPIVMRFGNTVFTGYGSTRLEGSRVLAIFKDGIEVNELKEREEGEIVLDRSPFYAASGGQVGDTGTLATSNAHVTVTDTLSPLFGVVVHVVKVEHGVLGVNDPGVAQVDVEKRDATQRNHTATHLLHAALREVLGGHVKQAGSVVAPNYLRFDFNHYQPMTEDEIKEVERLVNEQILRDVGVDLVIMPVEEAIKSGAMALFGEKYSGMMRVLTVPGFSKELCGGTHVGATGEIGVFKIVSEDSIASGVRRIRAVTGIGAYDRFREDEVLIDHVATTLRTSREELPAVVAKLQDELKKARREADELRLKIATGAAGASENGNEPREVAGGIKVLAREAVGLDAAGMRQLSDTLLARLKSGVVVLGRSLGGKVSLIVRTSSDLTNKVPAGRVIKELAPIIGGKGGGKPDMAEGGGTQPEKLAEALEASYGIIEKMLG